MEKAATQRPPESALIVEGGALRGIFSTGVLDAFLEAGFNPFDLFVGVSSGASNLAAYLAGMIGRNARIYTDYSLRPEFIDLGRFLRGGHLLDLDWLWAITIREIRLDLGRIYGTGKDFIVVMTEVDTGRAHYHVTGAEDLEESLKASSAMPVFYRGHPTIEARRMTDGGVADPIPVDYAIGRGARRIMVIRSRRRDYVKKEGILDRILRWCIRREPLLSRAVAGRVSRYNDSVATIRRPPDGISIVEVCPPDGFRVSRLSKDPAILREGYEQGKTLAREAMARWEDLETATGTSRKD